MRYLFPCEGFSCFAQTICFNVRNHFSQCRIDKTHRDPTALFFAILSQLRMEVISYQRKCAFKIQETKWQTNGKMNRKVCVETFYCFSLSILDALNALHNGDFSRNMLVKVQQSIFSTLEKHPHKISTTHSNVNCGASFFACE